MTTTEQKQEMVLPSFFYAIASSESRQLISLDELQRIITLDAMTQARTEDYRKNMRISSELAHQTKVLDDEGRPADTLTRAQYDAMWNLLRKLKITFPQAKIVGHRDLPGTTPKACPCFDAAKKFPL